MQKLHCEVTREMHTTATASAPLSWPAAAEARMSSGLSQGYRCLPCAQSSQNCSQCNSALATTAGWPGACRSCHVMTPKAHMSCAQASRTPLGLRRSCAGSSPRCRCANAGCMPLKLRCSCAGSSLRCRCANAGRARACRSRSASCLRCQCTNADDASTSGALCVDVPPRAGSPAN